MSDVAQQFAARLKDFERDGDVEPLVELFADDAELSKLDHLDVEHGRDGARRFWTQYREVFGDIASTFSATTVGDDRAVLEWNAEGTLAGGRPISYPGVSVLETSGGRIRAFRTYYDSAPFVVEARA